MKSDEILAKRLASWACPDGTTPEECSKREHADMCAQCWLDWAREKAKKESVVRRESKRVVCQNRD